ncbi:MAG: trehalose-phosphatase [Acidobacteriota bacterium]
MASIEPIRVIGIPDFWERLRGSSNRFLALDYDGTLAPFQEAPMKAYPLNGVRETLIRMTTLSDTTLAIVSGRPAEDFPKLLGLVPIPVIASHGFETLLPDGRIVSDPPREEQSRGIQIARKMAEERGYAFRIEPKISGLALHTRGLPEELAVEMEEWAIANWSIVAERYGLAWMRFNRGIEIMAKGKDKGMVLRELMGERPPGTLTVYIGDDTADEAAFEAVKDKGIGIKVGNPATPTAATGFLPDCDAVRVFLETWLSIFGQ